MLRLIKGGAGGGGEFVILSDGFFSSPGQSPGRAIVLPSALAKY